MFGGMCGEGLEERFAEESGVSKLYEDSIEPRYNAHEVLVLRLDCVTLDCGGFLYDRQQI